MKLTLPFPPSMNTYWRAPNRRPLAGRHLISAAGRKYQSDACAAIIEQLRRLPKPSAEAAAVEIILYPPDARSRDIDNYNKALFDALTHAGVWEEDSQVKRIIDRWLELENGQQVSVPQSLPEALRLAADLAEEKQKLTAELAAAVPKVEFVDRYCTARGSMSFRQMAKLLGAKEPEFRLFLIESDIMYRLAGTLTPHHQHIDLGRFEVKTGTTASSNYAFSQARFTAKGIKWIGGLWAEHRAKGQAA